MVAVVDKEAQETVRSMPGIDIDDITFTAGRNRKLLIPAVIFNVVSNPSNITKFPIKISDSIDDSNPKGGI